MKSYGISPAVGVILLIGITAAVATLAGIVFLDLGSPNDSTLAGVETTDTPEGVEVSWNQQGSSDQIKIRVNGEEVATLKSVNESVTVGSQSGSNVTVIGVKGDTGEVISETETEYNSTSGSRESEVKEYNANTETVSGTVEINPGIENATVKAIDNGVVLDTTTTDSNGKYSVQGNSAAKVQVIVDGFTYDSNPPLYASTESNVSSDLQADIQFNSTNTQTITTDGNDKWVINKPGPDGTKTISSVEQLQAINSDLDESYRLISDIDASETQNWNDNGSGTKLGFNPIGTFTGEFDGNGHTISGLYIDRETRPVGLFSEVNNSEITDLTVSNVNLTTKGSVGSLVGQTDSTTYSNISTSGTVSVILPDSDTLYWDNTGGLIGTGTNLEVSNVTSTISIIGDSGYSVGTTGGIVGVLKNSTMTDSESSSEFTLDAKQGLGGSGVGGVIGSGEGNTLTNLSSTPTMDLTSGWGISSVGGLIGESVRNSISSSYSTPTYSFTSGEFYSASVVGGLVGLSEEDTVATSYSENTTINGGEVIGGLIGETNNTTIEDSYSTNEVSGEAEIGGLVGVFDGGGTIQSSYSQNTTIKGTSDTIGGLVGDVGAGTIQASYSQDSTINGADDTGGLVGVFNGSELIDSYSSNTVTGNDTVGGLIGDSGGTVDSSNSESNVTATDVSGGLIGDNSSEVTNSFSTGSITSDGGDVGGLIGDNSGTVSESYTTSTVSITETKDTTFIVGGFVGQNTGSITDSYSNNDVFGRSNLADSYSYGFSSGFVGENRSTIERSYTVGDVTGVDPSNTSVEDSAYDTGGFVGDNESTINNSYWDHESSTQSSTNSVGQTDGGSNTIQALTTSEMSGSNAETNMSGLDFNSVWTTTTSDYPDLQE